MERSIAIFPLQIVVFPGEDLNLHIFEPRYKQLITDCRDRGITFGIPAYIEQTLMPIGTEVELVSIDEVYPDGKMDVRTKARGLFHTVKYLSTMPGKLYSGAVVKDIAHDNQSLLTAQVELHKSCQRLYELLHVTKELPEPDQLLSWHVSHYLGLALEQQYQLLTMPTETARVAWLLEHLDKLLPYVLQMDEVKNKVLQNGHFKHLIPPM